MTLAVIMGCLCVYSIVYANSRLKQDDLSNRTNRPIVDITTSLSSDNHPKLERGNNFEHNIRASKQISEEALRQYLLEKNSPLASSSGKILESPYWSTIIAITAAEESYSKNPICKSTGQPTWNFYGMMKAGGTKAGLMCFDTLLDGWNYMNDWFAAREAKQPNIEDYRARYCWAGYNESHVCPEWEPEVLKVKAEVENLE